jgi:hypothetical protein
METRKTRSRAGRAGAVALPMIGQGEKSKLNDLGEKIFLDRYALKDGSKRSLGAGDTVVVCTDVRTGQREIGTVTEIQNGSVNVRLRDDTVIQRAVEHVDKPLETHPGEMMDRVARGIAHVEGDKAAEWERKFRWLVGHVLPPETVDWLVRVVKEFEDLPDVRSMTGRLQ